MGEAVPEWQETGATLPLLRHHGAMAIEGEGITIWEIVGIAGSIASVIALGIAIGFKRTALIKWFRDWWTMRRRVRDLEEDVADLAIRKRGEIRSIPFLGVRVAPPAIGKGNEFFCAVCHEKEGRHFPLEPVQYGPLETMKLKCSACAREFRIAIDQMELAIQLDLDAHFAKLDAANKA